MTEKRRETLLSTLLKVPEDSHKVMTNIPLAKPVFDKEMERAAIEAFLNERFVLGESVFKFEEEFAEYCDVDYAVSTGSGTDALRFALMAMGIAQGQQVITTPASFIATSNAVLHVGASPVFADIDVKTYTVDPEKVKKAVNRKSGAVIPVHLYGYPADMDSIREATDKYKLPLIEDACQAHGALYTGKKVGSLGDAACFSFYSSKNMTVAGDGGMLVTNDRKVAETVAKLRDCGRKSQYIHDVVGFTSRLNTVNAAIGRVQLRHLDEWNQKRRRNAETYNQLLSDLDELTLPPLGNGDVRPVHHLYVVRTTARDGLKSFLESYGVHCGIHYPLPIHLQPVYKKRFGFKKGAHPNSEKLCRTCLSLPMYPDLTHNEISFVSEKIHEFSENN
jgi:perosamine synthetase